LWLLATQEGWFLLVGLVLAVFYFTWLGLGCPGVSQGSHVVMAMTATLVIFGRAAGMSFGYAMDMGPREIVLLSIFVETALVLLFYPLFVLAWRHLLVIKVLRKFMDRTRMAAETHQDLVLRFGIPGLMFFVWFPFWMTGPLIGSIIGFMLGLRPWVNITVVLVGTHLAIGSWAILLQKLHEKVTAYSSYAPIVLVAILIATLAGIYVLRTTRRGDGAPKR
jgi:uncharacterized membrane protein